MQALVPIVIAVIGFLFGGRYLDRLIPDTSKPAANAYQYPPAAYAGPTVSGDRHASLTDGVKDLANNPISVWGFAAMGFVAVFLIAQLRAAGHEAGQGLMDTTDALSNPEDLITTRRRGSAYQARKAKKGKG